MKLDGATILWGGCALLLLLAGVFVISWLRHRQQTWLLWFGLPLAAAAAGSLTFTRPGWDADFLSVSVGNALRILAIAAFWTGARTFEGRKVMLWPFWIACFGWLGLCFVPGFVADHTMRVAGSSIIAAAFSGAGSFELWRGRSDRLASRWPAIVVFASFSLLMTVRTFTSPFAPFPFGGAPEDPVWFGVLMLLIFAHAMLAGLLMLTMSLERTIARQSAMQLSDAVTGLLTRRAFIDFATRTNRRRAGLRSGLALVVVDLDQFRLVNQLAGRGVGDQVLRAVGQSLEGLASPADFLFRLSGDRFCLALLETPRAQVVQMAERVRDRLHALPAELEIAGLTLSGSIGIAETQHPVEVRVILAAAEEALGRAKSLGGDRIVIAEAASLFRAQIEDIAGPTRGTA